MQRNSIMSHDGLQKMMSSFKQIERKIDKLQDDFLAQNKTMNDLRIMVGNLYSYQIQEEDMRSKIEKRDMSPTSLKRKAPAQTRKVIKAKSFEPDILKNAYGSKRPLKIKKGESLKKAARNRSVKKTLNEMESGINNRNFDTYLAKHFDSR